MDPPTVLRTLSDLKLERSSDVFLMEALARRFAANVEEFFPPQLETALTSFAELRFSDQQLLHAFVGRLDDLVADASPRRLVRLLRDGAALRLRQDAWLERLLPQLRRQLPNMHAGLPSVLRSLRALRFHGQELPDLLLAQGLLAEQADAHLQLQSQSQSSNQRFFIQLFERWSRLSLPSERKSKAAETAEQRAVKLISPDMVRSEDIREGLSLLAGLVRRSRHKEAAILEQLLEERLRGVDDLGQCADRGISKGNDAVVALLWMQALSLRSAKLWKACADAIQLALPGTGPLCNRTREVLPGAVQALASLSPRWDRMPGEGAQLAGLLEVASKGGQKGERVVRYSASQTLQLLHAACLHREEGSADGDGPPIPWELLARQTTRLARQLALQERRLLSTLVEYLKQEEAQVMERLPGLPALPVASLPPLMQGHPALEEPWVMVETGVEALLQPGQDSQQSEQRAVKFLGFEDTLTSMTHVNAQALPLPLAPSCQLTVRALVHAGWELDLRA